MDSDRVSKRWVNTLTRNFVGFTIKDGEICLISQIRCQSRNDLGTYLCPATSSIAMKQQIMLGKEAMSNGRTLRQTISLLVCAVVFGTLVLPPSYCLGQKKYNPLHPEVEAMVRKASQYLSSDFGQLDSDNLCLMALAYVEAIKRYEQRIPHENGLVQASIGRIKSEMQSDVLGNKEIYYMCLASILMCEVDAKKHENDIQAILDELVKRQQSFGAFTYTNKQGIGDTSQSQFAGLAFWVAKFHKFNVPLEASKNCLTWYVDVMQPAGNWAYQYDSTGRPTTSTRSLSILAASISSVYLFSDVLELSPKRKKGGKGGAGSLWTNGLPPSVSLYLPPKGRDAGAQQDAGGPLVSFNTSKLSSVKRTANQYFGQNFTIELSWWKYYYLYALERYAYFREKSEGSFREVPDWYDQCVDHLKTVQLGNGSFQKVASAEENTDVSTAFAVLFLVRASELLITPPNDSLAIGGNGFQENEKLTMDSGGKVKATGAVKDLNDVMTLLNDSNLDEARTEQIVEALGQAVDEFNNKKGKSRNEQIAFLRGLMKDKNFFRRSVAIKVLTRTSDFDNAPALIYALGDPDVRIAHEAHNGLRLISRKLDSISVPDKPSLVDFAVAKKKWTKWYLSIRPGASLWD